MANGTIAFDTLQTSGQITGTAKSVDTDYVVNGSAKAWVRYDQTSVSTQSSLNVSSVDDDAAGNWDVNFTANMADGDYAMASSIQNGSGGGRVTGTNSTTSSEISMVTRNASTAAVLDSEDCCVSALGDLA